MQLTIHIPDAVVAEAQARGVPTEEYVAGLLEKRPAPQSGVPRLPLAGREKSVKEFLQRMQRYAHKIPDLPDEALTRESFYER